ncbi:serine/threonine-protein kinase [Streptomyces sp. NBC_00059]|uniref:serine/threonine-protein kinase n=1 Tax=Streptomyces sp. NBC_00059 TaxID=2975635 RepID=UPI00225453BC|nr:serine/threonine-protein kinase [Streptomyces sp. NBC_00059]MCX5416346.1 serine/threonine protein kinase [Streptomyces sp. NBC_00059]
MVGPGDVLDQRYQIQSHLGAGGMGTAWRAQDLRIGRTVAVKTGVPETPEALRRFVREAELAGGLSHPNIATIHDVGQISWSDRQLVYIVMELVPGSTLTDVITRGLPRFEQTVGWARQICRALSAAHDEGIVHRDIKPSNVVVTDTGTVKVLDFGIAKRQDGQTALTSNGVIGTWKYMAPERWSSSPVDARSDLYSLGCVLMELWTGRLPFLGEEVYEIIRQHATMPPPAPSAFRPGLPAAADRLVLDLLAKDPAARPPHARDVERRLTLLAEAPAASTGTPATSTSATVTATVAPAAPQSSPTVLDLAADPVLAALRRRLDQIRALPADSDIEEFLELTDALIPEAQRELGPDHRLTTEALLTRALRASRQVPGDTSLERLVPKLTRVFGAEDRRTIEAHARVLGAQAGLRHVRPQLEEVIGLAARVIGPYDPVTLHAQLQLAFGTLRRRTAPGGSSLSFPHNPIEAGHHRDVLGPLLPDLSRGLPDNDAMRFEAHRFLAAATYLLKDYPTAARLYDELIPLQRAVLGTAELAAHHGLEHAHSVGAAGDPARAVEMLDRLIPHLRGAEQPGTSYEALGRRLHSRFKRQARRIAREEDDGGRRPWFTRR